MTQAPKTVRRCSRWIIFSGLLLMCGCSSFDRDWKSAVDTWKVTDSTDITGPWEGTWQSEVGSHSGALRCLITKTGDYEYHARFAATYWRFFHFGYDMNLSAEPHLDRLHFSATTDLGKMAGGIYHYDGNANSSDFESTYHSDYDHGTFTMTRPELP